MVRMANVLETRKSQASFWSRGKGSHASQNVVRQSVTEAAMVSCGICISFLIYGFDSLDFDSRLLTIDGSKTLL